MVEGAVTVAVFDVNIAGNSTANGMSYLQDEMQPDTDAMAPLNLGDLDLTTDEFILDEVDIHIQANLEDDLVKEALKTELTSGITLNRWRVNSNELNKLPSKTISRRARTLPLCTTRSQPVTPYWRVIVDSPVTEQEFLEQLHELNNKINFAKELSFRETLACSDIQDIVDRLKIKAVTKIREFILQKIYSFRKPMTNYQIPQNTLLKYRFFYQFLLANESTVAKEIRDVYVDTMSKIYYSYFKSYSGRLLKVQYEEVADKDDLMGVEDTAKKGFFSKPSLKSRNTIFTLGQREAVLSPAELEGPILIPHTAQRGDCRYPYETLFRSQHYALLDNGCREFLFLFDFFMVAGNSALDLFNSIMGKTLSLFLKSMSTYVSDCYDSIAVFLCIHIILRFRAITTKRAIPALDKYWEAVLELLWPRFELILEINIQSICNTDPQNLGVLDTRPHYITRRYAEFSSAIVSINQTFTSERTNTLLGQLQVEVENFVLKMAAEFPSRRDQLIFLINNYDMMLNVLMERAADDSKEVEGFQQLLQARSQEFIEEILSSPFGGMIAFVKASEALIEKGQLDRLKKDEATVWFSSTWKQAVEALSQDVMRSFTNFKNGTGIIQGALTQLIQYYHGFHKVLSQPTFRSLAVRSELINLHHLMVEVKKHKPNF
ncbi:vacuolar protein sorting-associated protein 52 homolog isoform X1 [Salvelinus fontinalis]|uniref:vacuolar protein sorting-associated protein 52 homolog isoform X1 n=1 Tax=Salvelinus fontinalis TaxID=8038 RepID=UPI00248637C6|nr:vacuolar protein sorting-associated protein 52 homolog isoform X1 [Salvelinus fontinalis]